MYNLSNKKNVYIIKKHVYMCMWEVVFDKYISAATWPPQIKIPSSSPARCAISLDKKITTRYTGSTWSLPTPWRYINHKPKRRVQLLLFISSCSDCLLRFPRSFTASLPPSLPLSLSLSVLTSSETHQRIGDRTDERASVVERRGRWRSSWRLSRVLTSRSKWNPKTRYQFFSY